MVLLLYASVSVLAKLIDYLSPVLHHFLRCITKHDLQDSCARSTSCHTSKTIAVPRFVLTVVSCYELRWLTNA